MFINIVQPGLSRFLQWANINVIEPLICGNSFGPQYTSGDATICLRSRNVASCTVRMIQILKEKFDFVPYKFQINKNDTGGRWRSHNRYGV